MKVKKAKYPDLKLLLSLVQNLLQFFAVTKFLLQLFELLKALKSETIELENVQNNLDQNVKDHSEKLEKLILEKSKAQENLRVVRENVENAKNDVNSMRRNIRTLTEKDMENDDKIYHAEQVQRRKMALKRRNDENIKGKYL